MQPAEFIESLSRHYSKRHESEARQIAWTREMIDCVKGTDPKVLRRAYEMIRDEHDERAFPLPAAIKKWIYRACEAVYPDSIQSESNFIRPRIERYETPEWIETCRQARIWQTAIIKQYGSWAAYHRATYSASAIMAAKVQRPTKRPAENMPLAKLRTIRRAKLNRIDKVAMEVMQRRSRNRHLYVDHGALARRITGERYE